MQICVRPVQKEVYSEILNLFTKGLRPSVSSFKLWGDCSLSIVEQVVLSTFYSTCCTPYIARNLLFCKLWLVLQLAHDIPAINIVYRTKRHRKAAARSVARALNR